MRNDSRNLAILLLVSLLLNIYLFFNTYVISLDGAFQYIPIAHDFVSGFYGKALAHNQQPLYSIFVALASQLISDLEQAAKLVSSFFGILIIFPVYFLGKRIFDQKIAFLSVLFLVIHPYIRRFSADVLKESTYLFFFSMAIWYSWRTIQSEKKYPYLFIPLFSVLAYLVRPDGVEILIGASLFVLFFKRFNTPQDRWIVFFLLLLSSFILFLPYLIHLRETTGVWTLSRAKTLNWFLGFSGSASEISLIKRGLFTFKDLSGEILSICHPLYIFLIFIGLWKNRIPRLKDGEKLLLLFLILHLFVLFMLIFNITEWDKDGSIRAVHFSGRHVLPLLLLSIYWTGNGILVLCDWIYKKIESRKLLKSLEAKRRYTIVLSVLIILMWTIILPKTLKPQRYDRLTEKWAGMWIRDHLEDGQKLITTIPRVAYYGNRDYERIDLRREKIENVIAKMRESNTLYFIIREREATYNSEIAQTIEKEFTELNRFEGKGMEKVIIYKRVR